MNEIKTISFIGSGNMATNLAIAFKNKGLIITEIFSRTLENAKALAEITESQYTNDITQLNRTSDLYIVALKDDAIHETLSGVNFNDLAIVHTSGSFHTEELQKYSSLTGCLYPMQTVNKTNPISFSDVSFFLEASQKYLLHQLENLTKKVSNHIYFYNSAQREKLHIAAVAVNNFTHFLLSKTKDYCINNNLDFSILQTLLNQTIENIKTNNSPMNLQTGPARRGDLQVIKEHLNQLEDAPDFQHIYQTISQLILNEFHGEKHQL